MSLPFLRWRLPLGVGSWASHASQGQSSSGGALEGYRANTPGNLQCSLGTLPISLPQNQGKGGRVLQLTRPLLSLPHTLPTLGPNIRKPSPQTTRARGDGSTDGGRKEGTRGAPFQHPAPLANPRKQEGRKGEGEEKERDKEAKRARLYRCNCTGLKKCAFLSSAGNSPWA